MAPSPNEPENRTPGVTLSDPEERVLRELRNRPQDAREEEDLEKSLSLPADTLRGTLQRLRSKHLTLVEEENQERPELTARGREALANGLPERRLLKQLVGSDGSLDPQSVSKSGLTAEERSAAIGVLRRRGYLAEGAPLRIAKAAPSPDARLPEEELLHALGEGNAAHDPTVFSSLRRRGLVTVAHRTIRRWRPSPEGLALPLAERGVPMVGALTPELLRSGGWRDSGLRPYDVRARVPYLDGARPHPYLAFLEEFEEILVGLGFAQAEGPLLETEFWNADVLFMPQEHPARSLHDVLSVRGVRGRPPEVELLDRVAAVHEGRPLPGEAEPITPGWRTTYDRAIAARPVLRSQTTAVSARFLAHRPSAPFRMYCLDRNFRRDSVDATHHAEFGQAEGIVGESGVTIRHLVGVFRELASAIGIHDLKIRPTYFPFTEPSIEGWVKHPTLGWIEVFPGGLFRPEVLRPLNVTVPVAAWGIGVSRLAMVALGLNDIRELFLDDLDRLTKGGP